MIGTTFAHYRLVAELGSGGMGVVYKALDEMLRRHVAVKVLRPEFAQSAASRARFLREARAVAAVQHPYIAVIHDAGEQDGILFLAMEYVEGRTLREIIRETGCPVRDALHRGCEIAEGLAHVHAAGIIHRDLKPGNIMVSKEGHAKILDFGLAQLVEERDVETFSLLSAARREVPLSTGAGTPAYMSPEQVRGGTVDKRSDIFAFGSTMFEVLTGRSLFGRRNQAETLAAILHDTVLDASEFNPEVPSELEWILEKCLAKEPRDRYQDTRDLVVDLDHLRWRWESGTVVRHESTNGARTSPRPAASQPPALAEPQPMTQVEAPSTAATAKRAGRRRSPRVWALALVPVVLVGLAVFFTRHPPPIRNQSQVFYERGLHYLREESESVSSLDNAIHMFNRALAADSTVADTWAALGEAYWMHYQLSKEAAQRGEAVAAVSHALALDPDCAAALNAEGRGFIAQGSYTEARDALLRAVEHDKKNDVAWANLGRAYSSLREYAEGLRAIQRAIELNPQSFRHRVALGNFYRAFGEKEAAVAAYRQAIELKPNSNYAWNNLGSVLLQQGEYEKAVDAFQNSITIVDNAVARSNLGTAYHFMKKYDAAEREFRHAIELAPQEVLYYENCIDALIKLGKQSEVEATSRAALGQARVLVQSAPRDADAHLRLAILCARAGDQAGAIQEAAQAVQLDPEDVQVLFRNAKLHCILTQTDPALDSLEKAVKLGLGKVEIVNDPDLEILRDNPRFQRLVALAD